MEYFTVDTEKLKVTTFMETSEEHRQLVDIAEHVVPWGKEKAHCSQNFNMTTDYEFKSENTLKSFFVAMQMKGFGVFHKAA